MRPLPASPKLPNPALLAEYEARFELWRAAHLEAEAAGAALERRFDAHSRGMAGAPDERDIRQVLELRLRATRLHLHALQLLRDHPL
jgi:hypothetical protein